MNRLWSTLARRRRGAFGARSSKRVDRLGCGCPRRSRCLLRRPHELVGVRPDERVASAIDNDELRTSDAVVEHLRVMDGYRLIVRGGDDERRTSDLGQAAPIVERHCLPPGRQHQLAVLVRHDASEPVGPVGTFLAELLQAL
jgi:hypothetical protein